MLCEMLILMPGRIICPGQYWSTMAQDNGTFGRDNQTSAFRGTSIYRFNDVDHLSYHQLRSTVRYNEADLLFVRHGPVATGISEHCEVTGSEAYILLLLPVPRSIMMCLFRKKNMTVQGSYSSYIWQTVSMLVVGRECSSPC